MKKSTFKPSRFSDVDSLQQRIQRETPVSGQYLLDSQLVEAQKGSEDDKQFHSNFKINFGDLPISHQTIQGLNNRRFEKMTEIQRCSIPHALADRDIIATSRTGSGKTLAYLIPLVQKLYRQKMIPLDGLGAIVLVPVRELAMQVFEVLNSFTAKSQLSIGLIIGGKNVEYEQQRIKMLNVLICTPGRLLQHLEETYGFETHNLQMLVLDEADVMLEMGFREPLKAILSSLPKCQTLCFSATLSRDVQNLSKICMSNPQTIFLHSENLVNKVHLQDGQMKSSYQTPVNLSQYFMRVEPSEKLSTLYSFLKSHLKQKILVFVSTCKQVRFIYECFRKFKMGSPLYQLQGHQKQKKRMAIYFTFCQKKYGVLVCTNIASRGLDFPLIDWVIQFDIPENVETYIHRVGRTARFRSEGKSLAFVSESEATYVDLLKERGIEIHKIVQNPQRFFEIESSVQSICSEHQDVKYLAQRALISYLKFVHKASNKQVFTLDNFKVKEFSASFGLLNAPHIEFKTKQTSKITQDDKPISKIDKLRIKSKLKKIMAKKESIVSSLKQQEPKESNDEQEIEESEDENLLKVKEVMKMGSEKMVLNVSKNQLKKVKGDGHFDGRNIIHFDESLNPMSDVEFKRRKRISSNKEHLTYDVLQELRQRVQTHQDEDQLIEKKRRKIKRNQSNHINHPPQADSADFEDDQSI